MSLFTTGMIENTAVAGVRPSATVTLSLTNDSVLAPLDVQIFGYQVIGPAVINATPFFTTKTMYAAELFSLAPGQVAVKGYDVAQYDRFEFTFNALVGMEISVWGKDANGNLTFAQRVVPAELNIAIP